MPRPPGVASTSVARVSASSEAGSGEPGAAMVGRCGSRLGARATAATGAAAAALLQRAGPEAQPAPPACRHRPSGPRAPSPGGSTSGPARASWKLKAAAAVSGSEPSDAIRAVNSLLTQLDQLRRFPNVMVLTTSNITAAIDVAFVDRADIKAYIGPPSLAARYEMLRGSVAELSRAGVIADDARQLLLPYNEAAAHHGGGGGGSHSMELYGTAPSAAAPSAAAAAAAAGLVSGGSQPACSDGASGGGWGVGGGDLLGGGGPGAGRCGPAAAGAAGAAAALSICLLAAAAACEGLSGRTLRKLPFLAPHIGAEPH
ncbi:Pachytene checkpoint protein 2 [Tetrabaena socialis]|uniref:Pachytene checkpoint protein 2 n=1 Tax=Tetrabaena socialis TaxID=47790 RepID=A0A2J7ZWQ2_9CHLO|nr:Pachytene checkpoint protein 2 [Tetrabaena socialis]|eukprot:PNH04707.1 Pachytene checkpoint protein 2 [Tetrabaena socialis]